MADTGIFCTTAEVMRKVGANASAVSNVEAYINQYVTEAESYINSVTRKNWSDAYSTLNVDVKGVLKRCASALAAMDVIDYDMSGLYTITEAQTRLNYLSYVVDQCIALLSQSEVKVFVTSA